MKLVKDGRQPFVTDSDVVIRAYKQNGWTESKEEPVKVAPKKTKKD